MRLAAQGIVDGVELWVHNKKQYLVPRDSSLVPHTVVDCLDLQARGAHDSILPRIPQPGSFSSGSVTLRKKVAHWPNGGSFCIDASR